MKSGLLQFARIRPVVPAKRLTSRRDRHGTIVASIPDMLVDAATVAGLVILYFLYDWCVTRRQAASEYSATSTSTRRSHNGRSHRGLKPNTVAVLVSLLGQRLARAERFAIVSTKERHDGRTGRIA